jgi:hypothetical protein
MRPTRLATAVVIALGVVGLAACGNGSYSKHQPAAPAATVPHSVHAVSRGDTTNGY